MGGSTETDVLVIGGGPAGLATAIAARQNGLRAVVVDHRVPPIDKPCGEGLLPEGVAALRALGVELDSEIAAPLNGLEFSTVARARAEFGHGQAWGCAPYDAASFAGGKSRPYRRRFAMGRKSGGTNAGDNSCGR